MKKLYVITRADLPIGDQAVQAGHVVSLIARSYPFENWRQMTFVYVTVPDEKILSNWIRKVHVRRINFYTFQEPGRNMEWTALACFHDGKLFDKLKLMGS